MIQFFDHGMGTFTSRQPIPLCRWDRFDLLCVHTGKLQLMIDDDVKLNLGRATGVLIYPHTRFYGEASTAKCRVTVQHFKVTESAERNAMPQVFRELLGRRGGCDALNMRPFERVRSDIARSMELAFMPRDLAIHDARVALLTLILSQCDTLSTRAVPTESHVWDDLSAWLRQRLNEDVSVEAMAAQVGLSASHFSQRFRIIFGVSPGKYFQRLRVQEALRLLRETTLPVKTIAYRLNYPDVPNFYRAIRRAAGVAPVQYRERHTLRG